MRPRLLKNPLRPSLEKKSSNLIKSNFILLRHAQSKYNVAIKSLQNIENFMDSQYFEKVQNHIRFGNELMDCDITDKGLQECLKTGVELKGYNIKYVFVSPMTRCLMTCNNVLNAANIKVDSSDYPEVIIHPLLFEKIEDTCDLLKYFERNKNKWANYNWDLFNEIEYPHLYQLKYCDLIPSQNEKFAKNKSNYYYNHALENWNKDKNFDYHDLVLNSMKSLSHKNEYIESSSKTIERLDEFKQFLISFFKKNKLKENEKVIVIGHSVIFKHLTNTHLLAESYEPVEKKVLNNCEYVGLSFD